MKGDQNGSKILYRTQWEQEKTKKHKEEEEISNKEGKIKMLSLKAPVLLQLDLQGVIAP